MGKKSILAMLLVTNAIFILKYVGRTTLNPYLCLGIYLVLFTACYFLAFPLIKNEKRAQKLSLALLGTMVGGIGFLLYKIDPMTIRVDRWSATTYFLEGLFDGIYPYGIHTHVSLSNFPSPFPLWQYLNIPFWLMGDVGIGLIAFLCLLTFTLRWFTASWRTTLLALVLLALSPCYWWEVYVRSDGLSNAILIFCVILWMEKCGISFRSHWIMTAIICGLAASTRLSAIIPLAIYVVYDYFKSERISIILSPLIALGVLVFFFLPYILWDTTTWVFFSRNPFMSQTSTGNVWILFIMVVIALGLAFLYNKNFEQYAENTGRFVFGFFLVAICYHHYVYNTEVSVFEDADFDISYLNLALPYFLYTLTTYKKQERL